jgi:hypothetical protein
VSYDDGRGAKGAPAVSFRGRPDRQPAAPSTRAQRELKGRPARGRRADHGCTAGMRASKQEQPAGSAPALVREVVMPVVTVIDPATPGLMARLGPKGRQRQGADRNLTFPAICKPTHHVCALVAPYWRPKTLTSADRCGSPEGSFTDLRPEDRSLQECQNGAVVSARTGMTGRNAVVNSGHGRGLPCAPCL